MSHGLQPKWTFNEQGALIAAGWWRSRKGDISLPVTDRNMTGNHGIPHPQGTET
jgi:hypothetical protein